MQNINNHWKPLYLSSCGFCVNPFTGQYIAEVSNDRIRLVQFLLVEVCCGFDLIGCILILLTPATWSSSCLSLCLYGIRAPIIDSFHAWKPPLCHKDTAKSKKCPW